MNSITGILSREYIKVSDKINILWTPSDNLIYENNIQKLGHNFVGFDQLYFGKDCPHVIICNNKILYYDKCKNISIQFHIPVLLVDHIAKPKELSDDNPNGRRYEFPSAYTVAMSDQIAKSWGVPYNKVIEKKNDISDSEMWQRLIFQTCKMVFKYYV